MRCALSFRGSSRHPLPARPRPPRPGADRDSGVQEARPRSHSRRTGTQFSPWSADLGGAGVWPPLSASAADRGRGGQHGSPRVFHVPVFRSQRFWKAWPQDVGPGGLPGSRHGSGLTKPPPWSQWRLFPPIGDPGLSAGGGGGAGRVGFHRSPHLPASACRCCVQCVCSGLLRKGPQGSGLVKRMALPGPLLSDQCSRGHCPRSSDAGTGGLDGAVSGEGNPRGRTLSTGSQTRRVTGGPSLRRQRSAPRRTAPHPADAGLAGAVARRPDSGSWGRGREQRTEVCLSAVMESGVASDWRLSADRDRPLEKTGGHRRKRLLEGQLEAPGCRAFVYRPV